MNTAAFLVCLLAFCALMTVLFLRFIEVIAESKREADALHDWLVKQGQKPGEDTSSLMDDSPAPLPEEWHRTNVVRFPDKKHA